MTQDDLYQQFHFFCERTGHLGLEHQTLCAVYAAVAA